MGTTIGISVILAAFYGVGFLLVKLARRFSKVKKALLWAFMMLGVLFTLSGLAGLSKGDFRALTFVIFGLVTAGTCALGLFKKTAATGEINTVLSNLPDATHVQKTTNTPQGTDLATTEETKTEVETDATFKEPPKPQKMQARTRDFFDFFNYRSMPHRYELVEGEIKAYDKKGMYLDVFNYPQDIQEKIAIDAYKTKGAEYAASVIHALPIVKSGQQPANVVTGHIFGSLVDSILADNYFSEEEELELNRLCELTGGLNTRVVKDWDLAKLTRARLIRDLLTGNVRPVFNAQNFPIVLQRKEVVVWGANNVEFITTKIERQFVAGSRGFNVRIAKGVYYRVGNSRGHTESREVLDNLGKGFLVVSNKHIFINATKLNKKIPLSKLISVTPYRGEVEICCEGNRGRPIYAEVKDSQFWANVIGNAQNWQ